MEINTSRSFKFSQALKFYSITNVRLKNIVHIVPPTTYGMISISNKNFVDLTELQGYILCKMYPYTVKIRLDSVLAADSSPP